MWTPIKILLPALIVWIIRVNLPDIKHYFRIRSM